MANRQPTTEQGGFRGDELADRLLDFSVQVVALTSRISRTVAGRHIAGQLVKAGTSVGAHYEEARGAESRADFIHKLGVALKECRESRYWLKVIERARLIADSAPSSLVAEANELCAILGQSILTAKHRSS
jgi:four helix bundle protein